MALAREAGTILAWDEGNQLYLLRRPGRVAVVLAGAEPDPGRRDQRRREADRAAGRGGRAGLLLLDADFSVQAERPAPSEASFVTIDPHGRYLAVGTRHGLLHLINRYGRPAGRLETMETLSHFCFVPDRPIVIGAAAFGMMVGVALEPSRGGGRLDTEIIWQERLMSNVGRLAVNGDGGHGPGQLLHAGHPALRSARAGTKGPITWAARSRTRSPTSPAARSPRRPSRASWP